MSLNSRISNSIAMEFETNPHKMIAVSSVADLFGVSQKRVKAAIKLDAYLNRCVRVSSDNVITLYKSPSMIQSTLDWMDAHSVK